MTTLPELLLDELLELDDELLELEDELLDDESPPPVQLEGSINISLF